MTPAAPRPAPECPMASAAPADGGYEARRWWFVGMAGRAPFSAGDESKGTYATLSEAEAVMRRLK